MSDLKLGKLPDRSPVKLVLQITPQLHDDLVAYSSLYRETYGREEAITDLVPAMLAAFLAGDRAFGRARAKGQTSQTRILSRAIQGRS